MIAGSDANGDGQLSASEFASLLAQASAVNGASATATASAPAVGQAGCCALYGQAAQTNQAAAAEARPRLTKVLASEVPELALPTVANAKILADNFSKAMEQALSNAGIEADPPFTLSQDPNTGEMAVSGDRPDLDRIKALFETRPDLRNLYHTATAVASHAYAMKDTLKFQQAYQQSDDPAAVVAQFASLSRPQAPVSMSMAFGSDGGQLLFNGKPAVEEVPDESSAS